MGAASWPASRFIDHLLATDDVIYTVIRLPPVDTPGPAYHLKAPDGMLRQALREPAHGRRLDSLQHTNESQIRAGLTGRLVVRRTRFMDL